MLVSNVFYVKKRPRTGRFLDYIKPDLLKMKLFNAPPARFIMTFKNEEWSGKVWE